MTRFHRLLDAAIAGEVSLAPVTDLLGIRLVSWAEGTARVEMDAGAAHHNALGSVHGGILGDLSDVAIGCALATVLSKEEGFTTMDLQLRFFRSLPQAHLVANAVLVRRGRRTAYLECEIHDREGDLVAKASSTCLVLEPTK